MTAATSSSRDASDSSRSRSQEVVWRGRVFLLNLIPLRVSLPAIPCLRFPACASLPASSAAVLRHRQPACTPACLEPRTRSSLPSISRADYKTQRTLSPVFLLSMSLPLTKEAGGEAGIASRVTRKTRACQRNVEFPLLARHQATTDSDGCFSELGADCALKGRQSKHRDSVEDHWLSFEQSPGTRLSDTRHPDDVVPFSQ